MLTLANRHGGDTRQVHFRLGFWGKLPQRLLINYCNLIAGKQEDFLTLTFKRR